MLGLSLATAGAAQAAELIHVVDMQILSILNSGDGQPLSRPASVIPYVIDKSCYNWALHFTPVRGEVVLDEELILPAPAKNWGVTEAERTQVDEKRASAITERRFDGAEGFATAGWCVVQDDPVGRYEFVLRQEGREIARLKFTVGDLH
jgi:hypothetical protein